MIGRFLKIRMFAIYVLFGFLPFLTACFQDAKVTTSEISSSAPTNNTPPSAPTAVTLISPASTISNDPMPVIQVSGVTSGDTIRLFSDSGCMNLIGQSTATGTTLNMTPDAPLADAIYNIYANAENAYGFSSCSSASQNYHLDTVAPSAISVVSAAGATYFNSLTQTPVITWGGGGDVDSGIDHYEIVVMRASDDAFMNSWQTATSGNAVTSLSLSDGISYYVSVVSYDVAGNVSVVTSSSSWTVDVSPPDMSGINFDDGSDTFDTTKTEQIKYVPAVDLISGVSTHYIALGSTPGGTDISNWTVVGNSGVSLFSGLSLTRGTQYFASIKAQDNAGNFSSPVVADGWWVNQELWAPNGNVSAMAKAGTNLYLGGSFTSVGPVVGGHAIIDSLTGAMTSSFATPGSRPRTDGVIMTAISDGSGGLYIAGKFSKIGGVARTNIARLFSSGMVDPTFALTTNNTINALYFDGTKLYLGGAFTQVNGTGRNYIAAVDPSTGALIPAFNPNSSATINTMVGSGSTLYVGGLFTTIGGQARNRIAAIDTTTGTVTAFNPSSGAGVNKLLLNGSTLYVAGQFTTTGTIGGQARNRIAALDTTTGNATSFNPDANNVVYTMALSGSTLYLGGNFTALNGNTVTRAHLGAVDTTTGLATSFNPVATGLTVKSLYLSGSTLYVGGSINGLASVAVQNLGAVNTTTGDYISGFNPRISNVVETIASLGSDIYIGGTFNTANTVSRNNIAKIDTRTGMATPQFLTGANNSVTSLVLDNTTLYMGGAFTNVEGSARNFMAAVDANTGAVSASFDPNFNNNVFSILISGSRIFVGGTFTAVNGGTSRTSLAAIDKETGILDSVFNPVLTTAPSVFTLAEYSGQLYFGGSFANVNGATRGNLAAVSMVDGSTNATFNLPANSTVGVMKLVGSTLYLGGAFTTVNGAGRTSMAAVDLNSNLLISSFNPNISGTVSSIQYSPLDGFLYASGGFTAVNSNTNIRCVAQMNANTGEPTAAFASGFGGAVNTLLVSGTAVYTGGNQSSFAGGGAIYFAPLNSTTAAIVP